MTQDSSAIGNDLVDSDAATVAYLDMNIWIQLGRGTKAAAPRWIRVHQDLKKLVDDGLLVLPLSAAHYLELWHRGNTASREYVAGIMCDLTRYSTLKPIQQVQGLEVTAVAAATFLDTSSPVTTGQLIGFGVNHAFDSPLGRLRLVDSLASEGTPEGPPSPLPDWVDLDALTGTTYEWNSLAGTEQMFELEFDRTPEHRLGASYAAEEQALRDWVSAGKGRREQLKAIIAAQQIQDLSEEIAAACAANGRQAHELLLGSGRADLGTPQEAGYSFLRSVPTADALLAMRLWKHRDTAQPWEQHDKSDFAALSVAIPYCDFVITERRWAGMARATGLGPRYRTNVHHGLTGLEALITKVKRVAGEYDQT